MINKIYKKIISVTLLFMFMISSLSGCAAPWDVTPVSSTGLYFDTVITITLYGHGKKQYIDECFKIADKYEKILSAKDPDSDIYKINSADGSPVTVSPECTEIIKAALSFARESDGAFDPTIGALSTLWDFKTATAPPNEDKINDALVTVGYENIHINGNDISLSGGARLDLGAIAKGFIADKMKDYLISQGIKSGIINLGGNVLLIGSHPNGSSYKVGIQKPFDDEGNFAFTLEKSDCSIVTSGIYERYFEYENRLYHHILDTKTGYPVENDISSITVITKKSTDADALSTMLFVMGRDAALSYAASHDDVDVVIITKDGSIIRS